MPRRLLQMLKACWATLAWALFLTGVIGCEQPHQPTLGADGAAGARSEDAAPEVAPRPVFQAYDEVTSYYMGSYPFVPFGQLTVLASGDVYTASGKELTPNLIGRATAAEMAAFVDEATRPETTAAFGLTDTSGCPLTSGDAYDDLSLALRDMATYKRRGACPGLQRLQDLAHLLREVVRAHTAASP